MKNYKPVIHISLWLVYILTYAFLWRNPHYSFWKNLFFEISQLPFKLILVYTAIFLSTRFLFNGRYLKFLFYIACLSFACGILHQLYSYFIVSQIFNITYSKSLWDWDTITKRMTFLNSPMLIALTLVVLNKYFVQKNINTRILNEKLSADLKLLKTQLHPHFFFNTLNNLYSLSLQKSDLASVMILKLSDLMRYTLDQMEKDSVTLTEELDFIKNYVAIEEIRYKEKVNIAWEIQTENVDVHIPPLILSTFIENAFKHGVSNALKPIDITIKLSIENSYLQYSVINTLPAISNELIQKKKSGLGLDNLKQRLDLIYGKDYTLTITENSNFKAYLCIPVINENI